ncbi:MAG: hypothetical protein OEZ68_17875 [Gammaproteobacteria bacterium]|nr:hypothetical protein [Gammaproteobacteria bacterium]MDH5802673.1 hypothetical protein [Gammaproteobacteria bacterium]
MKAYITSAIFCLLALSCSSNSNHSPTTDSSCNNVGTVVNPECTTEVGGNGEYVYPIGIPPVDWSIDPIKEPSPSRPAGWPNEATESYYFIDPSHAAATDSNNPYGTPNLPRTSFPPNPITAGSYIELGGSGFVDRYRLRFQCTAQAPCWLKGENRDNLPTITGQFTVEDATYLFMEHLDFNGGDGGAIAIIGMNSHHVTIRDSYIQNRRYVSHTSGIGITPNTGGTIHDVFIYNNVFRELGVWQNALDEDFHGIAPNVAGRNASTEEFNVWILNNTFYHISGNGVQVVAGNWPNSYQYLHHIYIGKNLAYENRQAGFWSKQSSDVIMSQNMSHSHRQYGGGMGDGIGYQYGPNNLWIIFNNLSDSNFGIRQSDTSPGFEQNRAYIVGNLIHNIHPEPGYAYDPNIFWRPGVGISLWGGVMQRFIADNTIYNTRGGISLVFDGPATISGNIISGIDDSDYFVSAFLGGRSGAAQLDNLLFYNPSGIARFRWDSNKYYDNIDSFIADTGQCVNECLNADPLFQDPDATPPNLRLSQGSPAQDPTSSRAIDVYEIFQSLYGIDIRKDFTGQARPSGVSIDYGAYELIQ